MKDIISNPFRTLWGIKRGIRKYNSIIAPTYGPRGGNIALDLGGEGFKIVNDGNLIGKQIFSDNRLEAIGIQMNVDASDRTNDGAGDGNTATSIILNRATDFWLWSLLLRADVYSIRQGILMAANEAVRHIKAKMTQPVDSHKQWEQVATISSNNADLGKEIADAMLKVGQNAPIAIDTLNYPGITTEIIQGMTFAGGYEYPFMMTDREHSTADLDKPLLVLTPSVISDKDVMISLLRAAQKENRPNILFVGGGLAGDALAIAYENISKSGFKIASVKQENLEILRDIAALTGGVILGSEFGVGIKEAAQPTFNLKLLGQADKIIAKFKDAAEPDVMLVGGSGRQDDIDQRIKELTDLADKSADNEKDALMVRVGKLTGGAAVIRVGSFSEMMTNDLKMKAEDAVKAARAAVAEGVVPGGGVAAFRASKHILEWSKQLRMWEHLGAIFMAKALQKPLLTNLVNSHQTYGPFLFGKLTYLKNDPNLWFGFDTKRDVYCDLSESGIIDPMKVVRLAIENAAGQAAQFYTIVGGSVYNLRAIRAQHNHKE